MQTEIIKPTTTETASASLNESRKARWSYYLYCEIIKLFRDPAVLIFGIGFPSMFFLIFGSAFAQYAETLLAQYAAYGAFTVAFQTFSISVATERTLGWNRLLRTTPISVALYLTSKLLVVLLTGTVSLVVLFLVGTLSGKVQFPIATWLLLGGSMVLGMIPFTLAGIFLGFIGSANLSQIVSTVVTLLLSFTSGLFLPLQFLPGFVRAIAPFLPTYHLGQVAWYVVGSKFSQDSTPLGVHLLVLGIFTVAFALLAAWAYIRDENKTFA